MVRKTASSLLSVPPQSEHSLKPLYQPHFSPVWTMRPELQKHKKTHSCYAAKLWGRQQTKTVRLKTFTWFSPPARPAEKQECKQKKTARRGRAPTWREFAGVGEDREVEGGREGKGRLFLSLQTVYITKEESLEHNRAFPRATAQPVLSCCQSVAAAWTLRVFKRPTLAGGLQ